jgi:hypothetical protein
MTIASGQVILASDILNIQNTAISGQATANTALDNATTAVTTATAAQTAATAVQTLLTPAMAQTGIIIPYYVYVPSPFNDSSFSGLLTAIRSNPTVPTIVIVNQAGVDGHGGPGPTYDANVAQVIKMLKASGAAVAGYVSTVNGTRAANLVEADILNWNQLYGAGALDGVFYDQVPYDPGTANANVVLYQGYYAYAHTNGYKFVVGNSGTPLLQVWYDTVVADVYCVYESSTWPTPASFSIAPPQYYQGAITDYPIRHYAALVSSAAWDQAKFTAIQPWIRWIYATDSPSPASPSNPWGALPTYLNTLFAAASVPPGALTALTALINTLPTSLPASAGQLWLNGQYLCVS